MNLGVDSCWCLKSIMVETYNRFWVLAIENFYGIAFTRFFEPEAIIKSCGHGGHGMKSKVKKKIESKFILSC